ncbi:MAG TPA: hypothetical protein VG756_17535 [Pseudonocardiaceae bacterium]|nr:hypothetical protein [Pseudonocardiaceae bacterium]
MDDEAMTRLRQAISALTRKGRTVESRIRAARGKVVAAATEGLPAKQQQRLLDALPALEALVEQLRGSTR